MKIGVAPRCEKLCITTEDGEQLRSEIVAQLSKGERVELDFADVEVFASPFLNAAVGSLLRDYKPEDLNSAIRFINLSPEDAQLLRRVIENARDYFANLKAKQIVDSAVKRDDDERT